MAGTTVETLPVAAGQGEQIVGAAEAEVGGWPPAGYKLLRPNEEGHDVAPSPEGTTVYFGRQGFTFAAAEDGNIRFRFEGMPGQIRSVSYRIGQDRDGKSTGWEVINDATEGIPSEGALIDPTVSSIKLIFGEEDLLGKEIVRADESPVLLKMTEIARNEETGSYIKVVFPALPKSRGKRYPDSYWFYVKRIDSSLTVHCPNTFLAEFPIAVPAAIAREEEVKMEAPASRPEGEKAKLPAFLEGDEETGYKLPEGYKWIELPPRGEQKIPLGLNPGDQVVCYLGNVGVVVERGDGGTANVRFAGIPLPEFLNVRKVFKDEVIDRKDIGPKGIPIGFVGDKHVGINVNTSGERIDGECSEGEITDFISIYLPRTIKVGNVTVQVSDFGFWGVLLEPDYGDKKAFVIKNDHTRSSLKIALPAAEAKKVEVPREVEAARVALPSEATVRGKAAEAVGEAVPAGRGETGRRVEASPQQRFSVLITQVQEQLRAVTADRGLMRGNLLELFDLAAEITAADPAGEQKLVKSLSVLLRVAKGKEIIFSDKTKGKTAAERRDMVVALVSEAKTLVGQSYALLPGQRERLGEVMRQLLDHTVALGSGDKMGTSLARLLRIAKGKQVKLGGEHKWKNH